MPGSSSGENVGGVGVEHCPGGCRWSGVRWMGGVHCTCSPLPPSFMLVPRLPCRSPPPPPITPPTYLHTCLPAPANREGFPGVGRAELRAWCRGKIARYKVRLTGVGWGALRMCLMCLQPLDGCCQHSLHALQQSPAALPSLDRCRTMPRAMVLQTSLYWELVDSLPCLPWLLQVPTPTPIPLLQIPRHWKLVGSLPCLTSERYHTPRPAPPTPPTPSPPYCRSLAIGSWWTPTQ